MPPKKLPLDKLLVAGKLAPSLARARALIMAGRVIVHDRRADKPGALFDLTAAVRIRGPRSVYVSRGGDKLAGAIARFAVPLAGVTALDVGASTGGFTDCLLQHGARRVIAVDVGYGQLAWKLQQDSRVLRLDRTSIHALKPADLPEIPDLAVIDASFTSLQRILPQVAGLIRPGGQVLALVKPQFEAARQAVERGGVVRTPEKHREVISAVVTAAHQLKLHVVGLMESPIRGARGNREFFLYARKTE